MTSETQSWDVPQPEDVSLISSLPAVSMRCLEEKVFGR